MKKDTSEYKAGLLAVICCQLMWGFLPIYWHLLRPINSWVIILYRIVLVFVYAYIAAGYTNGFKGLFEPLKDKATRRTYLLACFFITINWSTYIWAVNANYVIQTSIGYYIEPLVICAVGVVVFKEKLTKYNAIAMGLALIAVIIILIHFGQLPWIGLVLAGTFAIYSAIKKTVKQPAVVSMCYETMWLSPLALIGIFYVESHDIGALSVASPGKYVLLLLCGLCTLAPMALFSHAATRVPLVVIGMAQYISPTISLISAVTLFGESMDVVQFIAFGIIWLGLVIFTCGQFKENKKTNTNSIHNTNI